MGQKLCIPNFEADQPGGDTYYMSPLTPLLLGVASNVTEDGKDRMNGYNRQVFEGDCGANNITSCMFIDFERRGWLQGPNVVN